MVTWEIVEAPHGRYNPIAAERIANAILAEAIENFLALRCGRDVPRPATVGSRFLRVIDR